MRIVGIDPGLKGGITVLDFDTKQAIVYRMPTEERKISGKKKIQNVYSIPKVFEAIPVCDGVFMERVGAMPGQGVSSTWRFAEGYGLLKAAIYARTGHIATLVGPTTWKRHFELSDDKTLSRTRALELFPKAAPQWKTKRAKILDEGVTESALIAAYGAIVVHDLNPEFFCEFETNQILI